MYPKFLICLWFLCGTLASKIDIGEKQNFHNDLHRCLSTVTNELCPDCVTVHLVIPMKPSWEADTLVSHFSDSMPTYAVPIYTLDRPGYEDASLDQIGLVLVNAAADLRMALDYMRQAKSDRNYVVWVNFYFGRSLDKYLKNTTPATWNRGNGCGVIFVALFEGEVQVFGTPIEKSRCSNVRGFGKLSVCDSKALIQVSQPLPKVIESQEPVLTVVVKPTLLPYIERQTDNPGGVVENLINIFKGKLNFTPKYDWSYGFDDHPKLGKKNELYIAFNLLAAPKDLPPLSPILKISESFWVVVITHPLGRRNFMSAPFKNSIWLHFILLATSTGVMVYVSEDLDKTRIMLRLFGMFLGTGVGWLPRKALFRSLVMLWCFGSYILLQAYLAALTSELSYPITYGHFHDARDLMDSGIEIFCNDVIKEFYCNLESKSSVYICEKCVVSEENWFSQIYTGQLHVNKTYHAFAFHSNINNFKSYRTSNSFHVISERIGMWPGVVYSNLDAQFLKIMTNISDRLFESGIIDHWCENYFINNITNYGSEMIHVEDVFIILYVGWSCSIVVFVIEILTKRYRNN